MRHEQDDEADDHRVGDAPEPARDPCQIGAVGLAEGNRALARDDECDARQHTANRQRGDEGRDLEPDMGKAGEAAAQGPDRHGERKRGEAEARHAERHDHASK
jgi:hypothetical protein